MSIFSAEFLVITRRRSTWILLSVMLLMTVAFAYAFPYAAYLSDPAASTATADLVALTPENTVASLIEGMPFYLGMVSLVFGAMALGSEFNWKTVKTTLLQNSDRNQVIGSKFAAMIATTGIFTLVTFGVAGLSSLVVAISEDAAISAPPLDDLVLGLGSGWLILSLWAVFGALLAVLSRGTAMAIGLGVLYGFLVEGLLGMLLRDIDGLGNVSFAFLRTNAYSLVQGFGALPEEGGEPGAFAGPFVDPWQALAVLLLYTACFIGITGLVFRSRDVS